MNVQESISLAWMLPACSDANCVAFVRSRTWKVLGEIQFYTLRELKPLDVHPVLPCCSLRLQASKIIIVPRRPPHLFASSLVRWYAMSRLREVYCGLRLQLHS